MRSLLLGLLPHWWVAHASHYLQQVCHCPKLRHLLVMQPWPSWGAVLVPWVEWSSLQAAHSFFTLTGIAKSQMLCTDSKWVCACSQCIANAVCRLLYVCMDHAKHMSSQSKHVTCTKSSADAHQKLHTRLESRLTD